MPRYASFGSGGGGGGGGNVVGGTLTGNTVEVLYDNRPSTETAFSLTAGTISWARTIDVELNRALTEDDDNKDLRIRFSYNQVSDGRTFDVMVDAGDFRNWTAFTTSTGTSGLPDGNIKFPISRGVSGGGSVTGAWNRQAMIFRRGDSSGNTVIGIALPTGDGTSYAALSDMRGIVTLVPRVDSLALEEATNGGSGGGGDFHSVTGLPQPSADIGGQVYFNQFTRKAEACLNVPYFTSRATTTWASMVDYYDNTGDGNEDMTVADVFPGTGAATSTDEDDYLYVIGNDHFYFGDTAPGSTYAWYHDNPEDALEALCNRYRTGESGTVIGASATIIYLGQLDGNNLATEALHALTVDLATTYYVYFDIDSFEFKVCDAYNETSITKQDHWQFLPILADPINPSIVTPGGGHSVNADHFELNQLRLESGHLSYVKPVLRDGHGATFTWSDYTGDGYTYPTGASWRGTVQYYQALLGFQDPQNGDRAFVYEGSNRGFWVYVVGQGVLATDWYHDNDGPPGYTFIGYPAAEADANALAQEHVEQGTDATTILAYYGGRVLRHLSAYSAPTATHFEKEFRPVLTNGFPTYYIWGESQDASGSGRGRWPDSFPDDTAEANRKVEFAAFSVATGRWSEEFNTDDTSARPVFVTTGNIDSDLDSGLQPSNSSVMVFTLPAGRWHVRFKIAFDTTDAPPG